VAELTDTPQITVFLIFIMLLHFVCSLIQIKEGFESGKDLVVTVQSAMGEEQICALKDVGPK
jgi:hypothetical protein